MKHPNIIQLYDYKQKENTLFLLLEYANKGSLMNLLMKGKLTET